jgi:exosortase N
VAGVLLLTFGLNIAANLFRIVLLVLFKIPAGNLFHDLVGMACLVLYVVLPLLWLLPKLQFPRKPPALATEIQEGKGSFLAPETGLVLGFLLFSATVLVSFKTTETKAALARQENRLALSGFRKEMMQENITRFENEKALIYVKPVHFYSAEHNPTVCWTGSGYEFTRIRKQTWQGREIYTGVLQKNSDKLYTAWWFDKGQTKTISHAQWRWEAFRQSAQFNLINVTAATEAELQQNAKVLLQSRLFERQELKKFR